MQFHILGLVDDTHPPAPELLDNAVMRDGLDDHSAEILGSKVEQVNEGWGVRGALDIQTQGGRISLLL